MPLHLHSFLLMVVPSNLVANVKCNTREKSIVSKWIVVSLKIAIFANVLLVLKSFLQQMFSLIVLDIYITLFSSSTSPHMVLVEFDNVIFIRVNRVICRRSTIAQIVCGTSMKLVFMLWIQRLILTTSSNGVPSCSIFIQAILYSCHDMWWMQGVIIKCTRCILQVCFQMLFLFASNLC